MEKQVAGVFEPGPQHWVGDGFPVRNLFPSNGVHDYRSGRMGRLT